jgi:hypothetical protein
MTKTAEQLLVQVLALSEADPISIAKVVAKSLDSSDRQAIDEAWFEEAKRRMAALDRGDTKTV